MSVIQGRNPIDSPTLKFCFRPVGVALLRPHASSLYTSCLTPTMILVLGQSYSVCVDSTCKQQVLHTSVRELLWYSTACLSAALRFMHSCIMSFFSTSTFNSASVFTLPHRAIHRPTSHIVLSSISFRTHYLNNAQYLGLLLIPYTLWYRSLGKHIVTSWIVSFFLFLSHLLYSFVFIAKSSFRRS